MSRKINARVPLRYEIKLLPSNYELFKSEGVGDYTVAVSDPAFIVRPGSRAEQMKNLQSGDSIIFVCNMEELERQKHPKEKMVNYEGEIEKVIKYIIFDERTRRKTFVF